MGNKTGASRRTYTAVAPTAGARGPQPKVPHPLRLLRLKADGGAGWTQKQTADYLTANGYPVSWHTVASWELSRAEPPPIVFELLGAAVTSRLHSRRKSV